MSKPAQFGSKVWFNGELVPWDQATVHVSVHGLHYGSSVFEGIRAYGTPHGPAVFRLDPHVDRLLNSCKIFRIDVPWTKQEVKSAIVDTVRENGHQACYIRPLVFRGEGTLSLEARKCKTEMIILTMEWAALLGQEALEQGVDVGVSTWRRIAPGTLPALAKIGGHYVNSQFIALEAHDRGFQEGIALDVNGYVSEGSGENLFLISEGILYTPPAWNSLLPGITRDSVCRLAQDLGYAVQERVIPREMLYIADELFFVGTAAEITPIRSVDGVSVGQGCRGPVTEKLQAQFYGIISGKLEDRHGWLTPVEA